MRGFKLIKGLVWSVSLSKALYGLKQATHAWFDRLRAPLLSFRFFSLKSDNSLFIQRASRHTVYAFLYVDDIIITSSSKVIDQLVVKLNEEFSLKDMGNLNFILFYGCSSY